MKITVDWKANALYISFREGKLFRNKKVDNNTIVDFDKKGNLLGIELLSIKERIPSKSLAEVSLSNLGLQKH